MKHLILGHASDPHVQHVTAALAQRGHAAHLIESQRFPLSLRMSLEPGTGIGSITLADGSVIGMDDIGSVYWRNFCGVTGETTRATRGSESDIAYYDSMACLRSWFQLKNQTRWCNSWEAFQSHQEKPHQLGLVAGTGVTIPRTYVGNNSADILRFCSEVPEAIFKPVYGGGHTERIVPEHLLESHLTAALSKSPITLQQYIGGTNVRTYVIGERHFSAELRSDSIDFRTDNRASTIPLTLPPELAAQLPRIMAVLGLRWTAIDWRRDQDGKYYFLEANPSPMFVGFEKNSAYPITDALLDLLTE